jgi:hypothetical protein
MSVCGICAASLPAPGPGQAPGYCSDDCRAAADRRRRDLAAARRWVAVWEEHRIAELADAWVPSLLPDIEEQLAFVRSELQDLERQPPARWLEGRAWRWRNGADLLLEPADESAATPGGPGSQCS